MQAYVYLPEPTETPEGIECKREEAIQYFEASLLMTYGDYAKFSAEINRLDPFTQRAEKALCTVWTIPDFQEDNSALETMVQEMAKVSGVERVWWQDFQGNSQFFTTRVFATGPALLMKGDEDASP